MRAREGVPGEVGEEVCHGKDSCGLTGTVLRRPLLWGRRLLVEDEEVCVASHGEGNLAGVSDSVHQHFMAVACAAKASEAALQAAPSWAALAP
ncbi:hypothetical protein VCH24_06360 [Variovorax boronicumulans]|nr:hypothetical protein VCH24_06360 [Variovorax boronicumulans]